MNLILEKKQHSLLSQIYRLKQTREQFDALLTDTPNDVQIQTRAKQGAADLNRHYKGVLLRAGFASAVLFLGAFGAIPAPQPSEVPIRSEAVVIETLDIPETRQNTQRVVIPRPEVPLQVTGYEVPEEVTIASTELAFDEVLVAVSDVSVPRVSDMTVEEDLEPVEIWTVEERPKIVRQVDPEYPPVARKAGLEGTVYLKVLVSRQGEVTQAEVVRGKEIFHQSALDAVQRFEFTPARQSDQPVDVWMMIPMRFRLTG